MLLIGIDQLKMITESNFGVFGMPKDQFSSHRGQEVIFDSKNTTELD